MATTDRGIARKGRRFSRRVAEISQDLDVPHRTRSAASAGLRTESESKGKVTRKAQAPTHCERARSIRTSDDESYYDDDESDRIMVPSGEYSFVRTGSAIGAKRRSSDDPSHSSFRSVRVERESHSVVDLVVRPDILDRTDADRRDAATA